MPLTVEEVDALYGIAPTPAAPAPPTPLTVEAVDRLYAAPTGSAAPLTVEAVDRLYEPTAAPTPPLPGVTPLGELRERPPVQPRPIAPRVVPSPAGRTPSTVVPAPLLPPPPAPPAMPQPGEAIPGISATPPEAGPITGRSLVPPVQNMAALQPPTAGQRDAAAFALRQADERRRMLEVLQPEPKPVWASQVEQGEPVPPLPGVTPTPAITDLAAPDLDAQVRDLQSERGAIETEVRRLNGVRASLDALVAAHPEGLPPDLYAQAQATAQGYATQGRALDQRIKAWRVGAAEFQTHASAAATQPRVSADALRQFLDASTSVLPPVPSFLEESRRLRRQLEPGLRADSGAPETAAERASTLSALEAADLKAGGLTPARDLWARSVAEPAPFLETVLPRAIAVPLEMDLRALWHGAATSSVGNAARAMAKALDVTVPVESIGGHPLESMISMAAGLGADVAVLRAGARAGQAVAAPLIGRVRDGLIASGVRAGMSEESATFVASQAIGDSRTVGAFVDVYTRTAATAVERLQRATARLAWMQTNAPAGVEVAAREVTAARRALDIAIGESRAVSEAAGRGAGRELLSVRALARGAAIGGALTLEDATREATRQLADSGRITDFKAIEIQGVTGAALGGLVGAVGGLITAPALQVIADAVGWSVLGPIIKEGRAVTAQDLITQGIPMLIIGAASHAASLGRPRLAAEDFEVIRERIARAQRVGEGETARPSGAPPGPPGAGREPPPPEPPPPAPEAPPVAPTAPEPAPEEPPAPTAPPAPALAPEGVRAAFDGAGGDWLLAARTLAGADDPVAVQTAASAAAKALPEFRQAMGGRAWNVAQVKAALLRQAEAEQGAIDPSDVEQLDRFVIDRGRIAPSPSGDLAGEYEALPQRYKSPTGLIPSKMAEAITEATGQPIADWEVLDRLTGAKTRLEEVAKQRQFERQRQEEEARAGEVLDALRRGSREEKIRSLQYMLGATQAEATEFVDKMAALDKATEFNPEEFGGAEPGRTVQEQRAPYGPGNPFAARAVAARARYARLIEPTAREREMEQAFPLGTGYGRKGGERRIEATINRAVEAEQARKDAEYYGAAAAAFDRREINAQGRALSAAGRQRSDERQAATERRHTRIAAAKALRGDRPAWEVPAAAWADSSGYLSGSGRDLVLHDHRSAVEEALRVGELVPADVLADYPDLEPRGESPGPVRYEPTPQGEQAVVPGTLAQRGPEDAALLARYRVALATAPRIGATAVRLVQTGTNAPAELVDAVRRAPYFRAIARDLSRAMRQFRMVLERVDPRYGTLRMVALDLNTGSLGINVAAREPGQPNDIVLSIHAAQAAAVMQYGGTASTQDLAIRTAEILYESAMHEIEHQVERGHPAGYDEDRVPALTRRVHELYDDALGRMIALLKENDYANFNALAAHVTALVPFGTPQAGDSLRSADQFPLAAVPGGRERLPSAVGGGSQAQPPRGEGRGARPEGDLGRRGAGPRTGEAAGAGLGAVPVADVGRGEARLAPVRWLGWQRGLPGAEPVALWNLTADIAGHPVGSTVGEAELRAAGLEVPPPAEPAPTQPVGAHTYSSTEIRLPVDLSHAIHTWAQGAIPRSALAPDGIPDVPHVTLLYGLHLWKDVDRVREAVGQPGPILVTLGELAVFTRPEQDVLYVSVESPALGRLREQLRESLPNRQEHTGYVPHVTVAALKPGEGRQWVGNREFAGREFTADAIVFSPKTGEEPTVLPLSPEPQVAALPVPPSPGGRTEVVREPAAPYEPLPPEAAGAAERLQEAAAPALPFFSQLQRTLDEKLPDRAFPQQVAGLLKSPGVKAEEVKWSGIQDWLASKKGAKVTKAEVLDFLRANEMRVEEVVKGGDEAARQAIRQAEQRVEGLHGYLSQELMRAGISQLDIANWPWQVREGKLQPSALPTATTRDIASKLIQAQRDLSRARQGLLTPEARAELDALEAKIASGDVSPEEQLRYNDLYDQLNASTANKTKFGRYVLPGAEPGTYRELLLTMPGRQEAMAYPEPLRTLPDGYEPITDSHQPPDRRWGITPPGQASARPWAGRHPTREAAIEAALRQLNEQRNESAANEWRARNEGQAYRSPHWNEPNVLAHVRFNDRVDAEGKRVLFIEEIQSDWHQQGRRLGYRQPGLVQENYMRWGIRHGMTRDEVDRTFDDTGDPRFVQYRAEQDLAFRNATAVPVAPFAKTWHEVVLKRLLRYAAEQGYDKLAWTTGEQQAERYDLSKHVANVMANKNADGTYFLSARLKDSARVHTFGDSVPEAELDNYIGKDLAAKIVARNLTPGGTGASWGGGDLKIGGEWAHRLYDEMIPQYLNKYSKKWGARVSTTMIPIEPTTAREAIAIGTGPQAVTVPAMTITPSMRQSILSEGQALFEPRKRYTRRQDASAKTDALEQAALFDLSQVAGRPLSAVAGALVRREPPAVRARTLALGFDPAAISQELRDTGTVNLRGRVVRTDRDLAVVAQVVRNPLWETMRVYAIKDGLIVGQQALTSRMPSIAIAFLTEDVPGELAALRTWLDGLGADGWYLLHNHPSGVAKMSGEDVALTRKFEQAIPGFRGHVVIDSGEYGVLHPGSGDPEVVRLPMGPDRLLTPALPHPMLGRALSGHREVVQVGREVKTRNGWGVLIYGDGQLRVRGIQEVPLADLLRGGERLRSWLADQQRAFGSPHVFLYNPDGQGGYLRDVIAPDLIRRSLLMDYVEPSGSGARVDLPVRAPGSLAEPVRAFRVEEPTAPYGEQRPRTPKEFRDAGYAVHLTPTGGRWFSTARAEALARDLRAQGQEAVVQPVTQAVATVWARPAPAAPAAPEPTGAAASPAPIRRPPAPAEPVAAAPQRPAGVEPGGGVVPPREPPVPPAPPGAPIEPAPEGEPLSGDPGPDPAGAPLPAPPEVRPERPQLHTEAERRSWFEQDAQRIAARLEGEGHRVEVRPAPGAPKRRVVVVLERPRAIADSVARLLAPSARGRLAQETAGLVRERASELQRSTEVAQYALRKAAQDLDRLPVEQRYAFIDAIETGRIADLPQEYRVIAEQLRQALDSRRAEVQALGTGALENFIQDYFPHIWRRERNAERVWAEYAGRRPLEGPRSFLKRRTIPTTLEGVDLGLTPVSTNPITLTLLKIREMDRYLMGQRLFQEMKDQGLVQFVRGLGRAPDGYTQIDDRVARRWQYDPEHGGFIKRGEYYAPDAAALILNNYLRPGLVGRYPLYDVFRGTGNLLNMVQLGFSGFHAGFVVMDTAISSIALGLQELSVGELRGAVRAGGPLALPLAGFVAGGAVAGPPGAIVGGVFGALAIPFRTLLQGSRVLREYYAPGSQGAEMGAILDALTKGGGRARMQRGLAFSDPESGSFAWDSLERFRQARRQGDKVAMARHGFPAFVEAVAWPIMEWLVPRMKLGVFADMARFELDHLPPDATEAEVRRVLGAAWDSVDNRLGQVVYDNLFWDRRFKDLLMVAFRSVGWNMGTFRELGGGAVIDLPRFLGYEALAMRDAMRPRAGRADVAEAMRTRPERVSSQLRPGARAEPTSAPVFDPILGRQVRRVRGALAPAPSEIEAAGGVPPEPPPEPPRGEARGEPGPEDWRRRRLWETGTTARLPRRLAYALVALPVANAIASILYQYAATGEGPQEWFDLVMPWNGRYNKDGTKARKSFPTYTKDMVAWWYQGPLQTLGNKLHPLLTLAYQEFYSNKDYRGGYIRNPDDPALKKLWDSVKFALEGSEPYAYQNFKREMEQGAPPGEAAESFVGVTPAPSYATHTPEQLRARERKSVEGKLGRSRKRRRERAPSLPDILGR